ncbi:MAG: hypothetical protein JW876_03455 [Candidatus Krumholzibacteriota bacterium]|nr:hypothetical protein [Candidatus Krumholzibacteriota bacterium]
MFPHIEYLFSLQPTRMKLGLENVAALFELVGSPQRAFPSILVAGTNGKGSVTTWITSILRRAGLRTGTFYSPHLFRVNERIRLDGAEIPSPELDRLVGLLGTHRREAPFTFFEGLTAAAALWFREKGVDAAVFEVGLGGRLDATKLVEPAVCVVTGIARDHGEHLGRTRRAILGEKLGIVRQGAPLVAELPTKKLREQAARRCLELGAPFHDARIEARTWSARSRIDGMTFLLETPVRGYGRVETRMIGDPQVRNAAVAVRTVEVFRPRTGARAIREGLAVARFPARFQVLSGRPRFVLDASHNEQSLLASLRTLRGMADPGRTVILFGVMSNKELGRFPHAARGAAREIVLVPLPGPRGANADQLAGMFGPDTGGGARVRHARGMRDAFARLGRIAREDDTILLLGSHVLIEEAVAYI